MFAKISAVFFSFAGTASVIAGVKELGAGTDAALMFGMAFLALCGLHIARTR